MMFQFRQVYAGRIGWVGIVERGDTEIYRTGGYHASAEGALERCQEWIEEKGINP
jgi:hypothetical protein